MSDASIPRADVNPDGSDLKALTNEAEDWRGAVVDVTAWSGLIGKGNNHGELASSVSTWITKHTGSGGKNQRSNMVNMQSLNHTPQSFHSAPFVELRRSFPSQIQVISPFVDRLMRFILHFRPADGSEIDIETAVREALANAMVHGNGENPIKRVHVECRCYTDREVSITVRDEGAGFDTSAVPDPTTPRNRLSEHGRGIYLMKTLMDDVCFDESGTVVHMRKKCNGGPDA